MVSNGLSVPLMHETVWLDASRYQEAERKYHELESSGQHGSATRSRTTSASIQTPHTFGDVGMSDIEKCTSEIVDRLKRVEKERNALYDEITRLKSKYSEVSDRVSSLEFSLQKANILPASVQSEKKTVETVKNGPAADDDDIDLFGSDEETEEDIKLKEARVKAYSEKKSKKPALVAKSSVVLDIKPWDDETDMKAMEKAVRKIQSDGLVWGASKLVPLAYGILKLQIVAIVEDEKVSIDWLQETIQEIEDLVQSVDVAAFNKL